MKTLQPLRNNLERIFKDLRDILSKDDSELFVHLEVEYSSAVLYNEVSLKIVTDLLKAERIPKKVFELITFWTFYGEGDDNQEEKFRTHYEFWSGRDVRNDFKFIQKIHYKLLEKLDELEENAVENTMLSKSNIQGEIYEYVPLTKKVKIKNTKKGGFIEFEGRRASIIKFFYDNKGEDWLGIDEVKTTISCSAAQLGQTVNSINKRVHKETEGDVQKIILLKLKVKAPQSTNKHSTEQNKYKWAY